MPIIAVSSRVCAALLLAVLAAPAFAQTTFTVSTPADTATPDAANCAAAQCPTLRDALAAVATAGGDTIVFAFDGDIVLTANTTLTVASSVTIDGTGHTIALDGNQAASVLTVKPDVTLYLKWITVRNGSAAYGGGVYNDGTFEMLGGSVTANHADNSGGGIYSTASVNLNYTQVTANTSRSGAGVESGDSLFLSNVTFAGNVATGAGASGGAIDSFGRSVSAFFSTFDDNVVDGSGATGGAIDNAAGALFLWNSTFVANQATGTSAAGGAVYNDTGDVIVINSTFMRNSADGFGGALWNRWELSLTHATLYGNTALGGAGIFTINGNGGSVNLANSIVHDCSGSVIDDGGNLDGGASCLSPPLATSKANADLRLGPLQYNGGWTQTMMPAVGSDALDSALDGACLAGAVGGWDQRYFARPQGTRCDIGAVEARQWRLTVTVVGAGMVSANAAADAPVSGAIAACRDTCSAYYYGESAPAVHAQLDASADPKSHFVGWSGDCAGTAAAALTMDANRACTATFAPTTPVTLQSFEVQ